VEKRFLSYASDKWVEAMQRENVRICVMRVAGTNRDLDASICLEDQGANVEILHLNEILRRRNLSSYHGLVLPGGFAYGDYVRAGAIWAKRIQTFLLEDLRLFAEAGKPILGICNGFQVLVEAGLLPYLDFSDSPHVALASNASGKFECRWVNLISNEKSNCIFTNNFSGVHRFPIAHGEGRFITQSSEILENLSKNNQIVLQYSNPKGEPAFQKYPDNPNGSELDVAGICSLSGTVFGLMPHPEDAYWGHQMPDWTMKRDISKEGDGAGIFKSMIEYIMRKF
jgi:phosphoribosylformylglycinamidine synthase subunit PurQ / glutaminase